MKQLLLAVTLLIFGIRSFAQEKDYAEIQFMPYVVTYDKAIMKSWNAQVKSLVFKLYLNDKLVTSLRTDELLNYKMYSKGRVVFTLVDQSGQINGTLEVNENRTYYVVVGHEYVIDKKTSYRNQEISSEIAEKLKAEYPIGYKNTITMEEDVTNPIGELPSSLSKGAGQGTCFALKADGYLITNYHVIENAKEITVKGIDGDYSTKYGATVVASDKTNDLALLKIGNKNVQFSNIPYAVRSNGVQQGEKIYAMGFPIAQVLGQEVKLTDGIISSKSGIDGDISKFQISAAVNPGNSGGPLIDEQGNLIGVIYAKSTIAEAASYAVKASYLETFLSNVDGFENSGSPGTLKGKSITDIIAEWKKFIFIVETN